jgi:hypothetical protein
MAKTEVRCPVCGTSMVIGNSGNAVTELSEGIHYLVPETVRNENASEKKTDDRIKALKEAGIDVSKLQTLMQSNSDLKDIFAEDDPIIEEISKGGFVNNPELFRRWITAQTWGLIKDRYGWTHAVRNRYDVNYVLKQTKKELALLCKLTRKCPNDIRFNFFTLDDIKYIFRYFMKYNRMYEKETKDVISSVIDRTTSYQKLCDYINSLSWYLDKRTSIPSTWLNCFKGAGAYYTLQNLIRTHGLVIPGCKDMTESLEKVEVVFKDIIGYKPNRRRWDILMSLLMKSVSETGFELRY